MPVRRTDAADRWKRIIKICPFDKLFASDERGQVGVVFHAGLTEKQVDMLRAEGLRYSHRMHSDQMVFYDSE